MDAAWRKNRKYRIVIYFVNISKNNGSVTFNLEVIALKIWLVSLLAIS